MHTSIPASPKSPSLLHGVTLPVEDQPPEDLNHRNAPTGTNPKAVKGPTNGSDAKPPGLLVTVTPRTHPPFSQPFRMEASANGDHNRLKLLIKSILHDPPKPPANTELITRT